MITFIIEIIIFPFIVLLMLLVIFIISNEIHTDKILKDLSKKGD